MNKHRVRKLRYEYIKGRDGGLSAQEREWRVWFEMDREDLGYEELVRRLERYSEERAAAGGATRDAEGGTRS